MIAYLCAAKLLLSSLILMLATGGHVAFAQRSAGAPTSEKVTLTTKDGVRLHATFYPSTAGKKAVPVVLLADHKDSQSVYASLARRLQTPDTEAGEAQKSFAVLTVDLRGHGDSLQQQSPTGATRELDAARLGPHDFASMVAFDMEAVRKFLVEKNDAGKLNLNSLSLVGSGMGAAIAVNWAAVDWAAPRLAATKQGQDIKALVLVSPPWKFRTIGVQNALRQPGVQRQVAMLILYGKRGRQEAADAKRIYDQLERFHPSTSEGEAEAMRDLMLLGSDTRLQGTDLLKERGKAVEDLIVQFLTTQVAAKDFEWVPRRTD